MSTRSPAHIPNEPDVDPGQMPAVVRDNMILRRAIWPRMNVENNNWVAIFVGETGSGKSWGAIRLAEALDPAFSNEQVAFNVEQFMDIVSDDSYDDGSIAILDEAGVAVNNRRWYEVANEVLNFVLQTWRHQNRGAILTAPELDLVDKQVQRRFHHYIEMVAKNEQKERTRAKIQYIDTDRKEGENYFWFHRFRGPDGITRQHRYIDFRPPTRDLRERYEKAKTEFTGDLNQRLLEKIKEESAEQTEEQIGPKEAVERIEAEDRVDDYLEESPGGQYVNRSLLKLDYGLTEQESKQAKSLMVRRFDLDVM